MAVKEQPNGVKSCRGRPVNLSVLTVTAGGQNLKHSHKGMIFGSAYLYSVVVGGKAYEFCW